jgi:hypothetical protein
MNMNMFTGRFLVHLPTNGFSGFWEYIPNYSSQKLFSATLEPLLRPMIDIGQAPINIDCIKGVADTF